MVGSTWACVCNEHVYADGVRGTSGSMQRRPVERVVPHRGPVWNERFHTEETSGTDGSTREACVERGVPCRGHAWNSRFHLLSRREGGWNARFYTGGVRATRGCT